MGGYVIVISSLSSADAAGAWFDSVVSPRAALCEGFVREADGLARGDAALSSTIARE